VRAPCAMRCCLWLYLVAPSLAAFGAPSAEPPTDPSYGALPPPHRPARTAAQLPRISLRLLEDGSGDRIFVETAPSADGRARVFHGTNVVIKGPPWLPKRDAYDPLVSLVAEDFETMREAGINLIRLGVMWAGAEPERGQYNETYFKELRGIVEEAASYGIYVLLDMHQDLLSERFCGEGIPPWAAEVPDHQSLSFPVPLWPLPADAGEDGFPTRSTCSAVLSANPFFHGWTSGHGTYAAGHAFEALYTKNDLTDAWGAFWARTAIAVKGLTNVLGFELINEPFAGNVFEDPLLMIPGRADEERLQPAYDRVVRHIRQVDSEALIFFAAVTWDNAYPVGFRHAPGGDAEANRSVLAYHFYTPPQRKGGFQEYTDAFRRDARRLGTGVMMTESCCSPFFEEAIPHLAAIGHSWANWEWKDWCKEDNTSKHWDLQRASFGACKTGFGGVVHNTTLIGALAAPYAPAVAGVLNGTSWDNATGVFELRFRPNAGATVPTEIFVNANLSFPTGFDVQVNPPSALDVELRPADFRVLLAPRRGAAAGPVVVQLRRRNASAETLLV